MTLGLAQGSSLGPIEWDEYQKQIPKWITKFNNNLFLLYNNRIRIGFFQFADDLVP